MKLYSLQWKTPDDGQRNCPKYVEFHSKNKFEKLVHLVGLLYRNKITIQNANMFIWNKSVLNETNTGHNFETIII